MLDRMLADKRGAERSTKIEPNTSTPNIETEIHLRCTAIRLSMAPPKLRCQEAAGGHRVEPAISRHSGAAKRNPESSVLAQTRLDSRVRGNDGLGHIVCIRYCRLEAVSNHHRRRSRGIASRQLDRRTFYFVLLKSGARFSLKDVMPSRALSMQAERPKAL